MAPEAPAKAWSFAASKSDPAFKPRGTAVKLRGNLRSKLPHDKFRLTAPPVTGEDLPHSTFTHRKRCRFDFSGDSGNTVYFCLRYENEKGGKAGEGPFGPLFSAIIP
jgi:hypothetical protein